MPPTTDAWQEVRERLGLYTTLARMAADSELQNAKPLAGWKEAIARACAISWEIASRDRPPIDVMRQHLHSEVVEAHLQLNAFDALAPHWTYSTRDALSPHWTSSTRQPSLWAAPTSFALQGVALADRITRREDGFRGVRRASSPLDSNNGKLLPYATRVWRFAAAAGRLPQSPDDDELFAAFEAAVLADAHEFATHLAKHGFGIVAG